MPKAAQHHALARQWQVLRLLPTKPPGITSRELVDKLEREGFTVTKRTVERDLAELSTIFGIACNDKGMPYGWHWMKGEYADLPGLSVSDAVSLRLVEDLLRPLLPSAILQSLEARFGQAKAKLTELSVDNSNARWADKVSYVPPALPFVPPKIDSTVLDAVHEALLAELQIQVKYHGFSGHHRELILHPLGLIQRGAVTYLVATAFDYADIRLYAVHRFEEVTKSELRARIPRGFSATAYVESGALEFGNCEKIAFHASVSSELAEILRESPINETQILRREGITWIIQAEVFNSWQLVWWILSQGNKLEVMQPSQLREKIGHEVRQMAARYGVDKLERGE